MASYPASETRILGVSKSTSGSLLAQLVVRNLEEQLIVRLERRAARHGRSMEEEIVGILRDYRACHVRLIILIGHKRKRNGGLRPSFSAHVRLGEHWHPSLTWTAFADVRESVLTSVAVTWVTELVGQLQLANRT